MKRTSVRVLIILILPLSAGAAFAEDVPQPSPGSSAEVVGKRIREESEALLKGPLEVPKLSLEQAPAEEPKAAATPFYVRKIRVSGNTVIPENELKSLLSPSEEKEQTLDDLNALCRRLEAEFQRRGYLAVVYLPPQRMEDQEATLEVLLSRLGEVRLEGARYFRQWRTLSYWRIPRGTVLKIDDIRENVLRMNENPDRSVRVMLKAGKDRGLTDIYLEEKDRFPVHPGASFDNQGTKLTGKLRPGFSLKHNNLLGLDDTAFVTVAFGSEVGSGYLYHLLPLPFWDLRLASHLSYAQVAPKKEFEDFHLNGISQDFGWQLRRYIFKHDDAALEAYTGFSFNEKRTRALGAVITRDRLRMLSAGADLTTADRSGFWNAGGDATFGLPFHDEQTALNSRQAGSSFTKLNAHLRRTQRLPYDTRMLLDFQGQWTPSNLTPQTQLFLGGADSVRGYPESDYGADSGLIANVEYQVPASFAPDPWKKKVWIVFFSDQGYGRLVKPSATEHPSRTVWGIGTGLNFDLNENFQASVSWGFPLADPALTESGHSQFHFKLSSNF